MAEITPEKAITILHALKNEYVHPEVKEACDLAIECVRTYIKIGKSANAFINTIKRKKEKKK